MTPAVNQIEVNPFLHPESVFRALTGRPQVGVVRDRSVVTLARASADEAVRLSNLLALYMHDMSAIFPVEPGADGLFRYEGLPPYWSQPATHFPFFIHVDERVGGFALVTRGSPASDNPDRLDVAEFFVLRAYRRAGIGRKAAFLLWNRLPGQWVVRVSTAHHEAMAFWRGSIDRYTGGDFGETQRTGSPHDWRVFTFASTFRPTGDDADAA